MLPSFCTCSCPSDWWKPRALRHYDMRSMSFDHRYRDVHMSRTPHVLIDSMTLTRRNRTSNALDLYNRAVHSTSFSFVQMLNIIGCMTDDIIYWVNITYAICNSYRINGGLSPPILGRSSTFPQNLWSMDLAMNSLSPHFRIIIELSTLFRKMRSWTIASVQVNIIYIQFNTSEVFILHTLPV